MAAVTGCELLTGIALLVAPRLGGFMSLGLLVAFSTVLVSVIVEGREVSCACFGAATSRPVDRVSLIRNLVLISVSLLVVVSVS